eukprot:g18303.t1
MFTEQAFLQRCSGEWPQVQYADGSASRLHMSTLINLDESYRFLRMLVLISGSSSGKGTEPVEMASELNRILQTGAASYACKNAGSFGTNVERKAVSVLGFGNAHPSKYVPILSGAAGNHDDNVKADLQRGMLAKRKDAEEQRHLDTHSVPRPKSPVGDVNSAAKAPVGIRSSQDANGAECVCLEQFRVLQYRDLQID